VLAQTDVIGRRGGGHRDCFLAKRGRIDATSSNLTYSRGSTRTCRVRAWLSSNRLRPRNMAVAKD
jgi:hypothetical protein